MRWWKSTDVSETASLAETVILILEMVPVSETYVWTTWRGHQPEKNFIGRLKLVQLRWRNLRMQLLFGNRVMEISVDLVHSGCGSPGSRGSNDQLGGRAAVRMAHTSPGRGRAADRNPQLSASHCSVLYCHSCRSFFIMRFLRYTFASFFFPVIMQQIPQNIFKVI